jgi:hypothetical protein
VSLICNDEESVAASTCQLGRLACFFRTGYSAQPTKATIMKSLVKLGTWTVTTLLAGASFQLRAAEEMEASTSAPFALPWEKGAVAFGGFATFFSSDLVFGIEGADGASINAEDRLGLESDLVVFRAGAMYRPGESRRHQLDFSYASYDRDGSATLTEELTIGGVTYPVGAQVETDFDFDIIRGTYSYAFWQSYRPWRHFGLGVAYNFLGVDVTGESSSSDYPGADDVGEVDVRYSGLFLYGKFSF